MSDLTKANADLMAADPLNQFRLLTRRDFTPSSHEVSDALLWAYNDLILAEEYGHPTLSQEDAIARAIERVDLLTRALKQSLIYDIKSRRGEWVAVA